MKLELSSELFSFIGEWNICTYWGNFEFDNLFSNAAYELNSDLADKNKDLDNIEFDYDYEKFEKDLDQGLKYVFEGIVFEECFKPFGISKLTYDSLNKPKYYNYRGDHVYFTVEFEDSLISKFIKDIEELIDSSELENYLKQYESCDGFISFTPSTIPELISALAGDDIVRGFSIYLDYLIIKDIQYPDQYYILDQIIQEGSIYFSEYVTIVEKDENNGDRRYSWAQLLEEDK